MSVTIATRQYQLVPLTHEQVDTNFINLKSAVDGNSTSLTNLGQDGGSAMIGFIQAGIGAVARTGQGKLREISVSITDYDSLADAINALPDAGGVIDIPVGRFPAGNWTYDVGYMAKANVTLRGKKMPGLSANADRLEGGSVIEGRFNVFADNFHMENIGFDNGKYVTDTYNPGFDTHTANNPLGGTWDAFAFAQPNPGAPLPARRGFYARNVIGLCRDSLSVGHAMLIEGVDGGFVDNVIGVCGVHGVVLKSKNIRGGTVSGWMASTDNVIIKSDTYAAGGHINLARVECLKTPPGVTPWSTPAVSSYGLLINPATASMAGPIQIGSLKTMDCGRGMCITGPDATLVASDIQIDSMIADGYPDTMVSGIDFFGCRAQRVQIGSLIVNNAQQGIGWTASDVDDNSQHQLSIGRTQLTAISGQGINASQYGRIRIDTLEMADVAAAYYVEDNARVMVGKETLMGVTTKWARSSPILNGGWSNYGGGNSTWDVKLENYGVSIKGLLLAAGGAPANIAAMPAYLRPNEDKRYPAYFNNSTPGTGLVNVSSGGFISLNDGAAPTTGDYISLDGIGWQHW